MVVVLMLIMHLLFLLLQVLHLLFLMQGIQLLHLYPSLQLRLYLLLLLEFSDCFMALLPLFMLFFLLLFI